MNLFAFADTLRPAPARLRAKGLAVLLVSWSRTRWARRASRTGASRRTSRAGRTRSARRATARASRAKRANDAPNLNTDLRVGSGRELSQESRKRVAGGRQRDGVIVRCVQRGTVGRSGEHWANGVVVECKLADSYLHLSLQVG